MCTQCLHVYHADRVYILAILMLSTNHSPLVEAAAFSED